MATKFNWDDRRSRYEDRVQSLMVSIPVWIVSAYGPGGVGNRNYAAYVCDGLKVGGYSDWYLPSKDELNFMWLKLDLYNLGDFATGGGYWSSSEDKADTTNAWSQHFGTGEARSESKSVSMGIRAIRKF